MGPVARTAAIERTVRGSSARGFPGGAAPLWPKEGDAVQRIAGIARAAKAKVGRMDKLAMRRIVGFVLIYQPRRPPVKAKKMGTFLFLFLIFFSFDKYFMNQKNRNVPIF